MGTPILGKEITMKNTYVFDRLLASNEVEEPIYEYPKFDHEQDLTLPMLPPPKRFLKAGSVYWVSDNIKYTFIEKDHREVFATTIRVNKFHNIDDKKLRLLKANYYFLRDKNSMSEVKSGFRSLVYNAETKALYLIRAMPYYKTDKNGKMKMKHNWKKQVVRVSINHFIMDTEMGSFDYQLREKFVKEMHRLVAKDVPGVKIECNGQNASIISLLIQHKAGCVIPGLNDLCIANLSFMSSHQFIDSRINLMEQEAQGRHNIRTDWQQREKDIKNLRRKSSYKFIPTLGETNSLRKALSVLLGECYVGIFPKIIFDIGLHDLSAGQPQSIIKYKNHMPKNIQHYVTQSLGRMPKDKFIKLFREVLDLGRTPAIDDHIKDNWIRTTRRLKEPVPWRAWTDTYRMAGQLGIRIRPNSFNTIQEIWQMHDRLSNVVQRQNRNRYGVSIGNGSQFVKVKYPPKYKGYEFKQLLTPNELLEETRVMGHCVHSYKNDCAKGHSIIFSVVGPDERRYTVEYSGRGFAFAQAEGSYSDNGGMRNICESPIRNEIFYPFSKNLDSMNKDVNYEALSTLNLAIIESENDLDALESLVELNPQGLDDIDKSICRRNAMLEDLITLQRKVDAGEYYNVVALIRDVEELKELYGFSSNNKYILNRNPLPVRAQVAPPVQIEPVEERNCIVLEADATEWDNEIGF